MRSEANELKKIGMSAGMTCALFATIWVVQACGPSSDNSSQATAAAASAGYPAAGGPASVQRNNGISNATVVSGFPVQGQLRVVYDKNSAARQPFTLTAYNDGIDSRQNRVQGQSNGFLDEQNGMLPGGTPTSLRAPFPGPELGPRFSHVIGNLTTVQFDSDGILGSIHFVKQLYPAIENGMPIYPYISDPISVPTLYNSPVSMQIKLPFQNATQFDTRRAKIHFMDCGEVDLAICSDIIDQIHFDIMAAAPPIAPGSPPTAPAPSVVLPQNPPVQ